MAFDFNGSSDYVTAGNAGTPNSISLSAWINLDTLPAGGNDYMILSKPYVNGSWSNPFIQYALDIVDSGGAKARMLTNNGAAWAAQGATSISTGTWTHVGGTYDAVGGVSNFVFVNGVNDGFASSGAGNLNNTNVTNLVFGVQSDTSTAAFLDGRIAEIGIWSASLSAAEMALLAKGFSPATVRPQSLIGYWPLLRAKNAYKGATPVPTGTTVSPHPRIIMPRGRQVKRAVVSIFVYMRPDADFSAGSWLNEVGTNVNLYASVDETVASDTDYIQSSTTSGDKVRLQLSNPVSGVAQPFDIHYRASATSVSASVTGRLYQGASTLISSWNQAVTTTPTNYTQTLNSTEFNLITDFNDLYIEFEYTP